METVMKEKKLDILALSWPIFVELLLQMLVGNADQIMVGWRDPNGVGAIGNANQITNLLLLVFSVVCTAAMILVSQYLGAGDTKRVGRTCTAALLMNLLFGLAVSLLLILGCGPIFRLMGVHDLIFDETCLYMRIIGAGMVFQAVYLTFTAFFRSAQLMRETMLVSIFMNCLNIGGNYILINGAGPLPALGVAGAALSSGLSRLAGVVVIACLFRRRFPGLLSLEHLRPAGAGPAHRRRVPLLQRRPDLHPDRLQPLCRLRGQHPGLRHDLRQRDLHVRLRPLPGLPGGGGPAHGRPGDGGHPPAGHGHPAGSGAGLRQPLRPAVCGRPAGLQPQILALAGTIMLIEIPLELGRAVNMVMCRALQACGDIRFPIVICIINAWLVGVGGSFFLGVVLDWGLAGLWTAMAADECIRAVLFLIRWQSGAWRRKRLLEPEQAGPM